MIKIELIKDFEKMRTRKFREYSAKEILLAQQYGKTVVENSEIAFALNEDSRSMLLFGVMPKTLLGAPNLVWLLAMKELSAKHFRKIRPLFLALLNIYGVLRANVRADAAVQNKFAKALGFRSVGISGEYRIYEASIWHF